MSGLPQRKGLRVHQRLAIHQLGLGSAMGAAVAAALAPSGPAFGFGLNALDGSINNVAIPADLVSQPINFFSWDKGGIFDPITYAFDASFLAAFPDPKQQEQVHLAFQEWADASADGSRRAPQANYHWDRLTSAGQNFWDLRTLITHEIGHVLGAGHPDAIWFNTNPDTGSPYNLNFRPDGQGGLIPAAPLGGEVMNEGNTPGFLPDAKPPKGFRFGEYNRKLSKDELAMLDYAYGQQLRFQFVEDPASADIVLSNFQSDTCGDQITLGSGQVTDAEQRDPDDFTQGARILAGRIFLRDVCTDAPGTPTMGFTPLSRYWEATNQTGEDVVSVLVRTVGTDNLNPTSQESVGSHRLTEYDNFLDVDATESLERILHQWSHPLGDVIAPGQTTKVALQQDVWDWTVDSSSVITANAQIVPAALVNTIPFFAPQFQGQPNADSPSVAEHVMRAGHDHDHGADELSAAATPPAIAAKAILLSNDTAEPIQIDSILLAPVGDLNPAVITEALLDQLRLLNRFEEVQANGQAFQMTLDEEAEFFLLLEGDVASLPRDVLARGNYLLLNRPGWMDDPLLVAVLGRNSGTQVTNYALLNTSTFVPEPASALAWITGLLTLARRYATRNPTAA